MKDGDKFLKENEALIHRIRRERRKAELRQLLASPHHRFDYLAWLATQRVSLN